MDALTLFNSDHRIVLSCTKSVRVLFERRKRNSLNPQDVTYNGQVIPSSSSVKFLGITFATLARHRLLKLNYIFSTTYGPLLLPSSASTNTTSVHCLITVRQLQLSWERHGLL